MSNKVISINDVSIYLRDSSESFDGTNVEDFIAQLQPHIKENLVLIEELDQWSLHIYADMKFRQFIQNNIIDDMNIISHRNPFEMYLIMEDDSDKNIFIFRNDILSDTKSIHVGGQEDYKSWFMVKSNLKIPSKCDPITLISQLRQCSDKAIWYDNEFSKIRYNDKCPKEFEPTIDEDPEENDKNKIIFKNSSDYHDSNNSSLLENITMSDPNMESLLDK
jgi:hypothetical protein